VPDIHVSLSSLPSLCQKFSQSVEIWQSSHKHNFAQFFLTRYSYASNNYRRNSYVSTSRLHYWCIIMGPSIRKWSFIFQVLHSQVYTRSTSSWKWPLRKLRWRLLIYRRGRGADIPQDAQKYIFNKKCAKFLHFLPRTLLGRLIQRPFRGHESPNTNAPSKTNSWPPLFDYCTLFKPIFSRNTFRPHGQHCPHE